ncbi:hypothetical protein ACOSQ3_009221 [Xanthoceras sorbifolium]
MHDLLQEMAWENVREHHSNEPGKWSRLWQCKDVCSVLTKNMGSQAVEGIMLKKSKQGSTNLDGKSFSNLRKLRLLKISSNVHLSDDLEYLSDELRFLKWREYFLNSLPSGFQPQNRFELDKNPNSSCLQLPPLVSLCSLQELVLRGCNRSEGTIPDDLDSLALLEQLDLSRNNFVSLPKSISRLSKLRFLCLEKCRKLQSLPELPREIMVVGAENCSSLEVISSALEGNTSPNVTYCFLNCFKLVENQGRKNSLAVLLLKRQLQSCMLNHVSLLYVLQELSIHSAHFHICLPGSEISKWFTHWSEGPEVQIGQSPNWFSKEFMGFAVCAVISNPCNWYGSECYCKFYLGSETIGIKSDIRSSFESDHLWLGYLSLDIFKILVFLFCFSIWLTLFVIFLLQLMAYGFWCCYSVFIHGFFFNCNIQTPCGQAHNVLGPWAKKKKKNSVANMDAKVTLSLHHPVTYISHTYLSLYYWAWNSIIELGIVTKLNIKFKTSRRKVSRKSPPAATYGGGKFPTS